MGADKRFRLHHNTIQLSKKPLKFHEKKNWKKITKILKRQYFPAGGVRHHHLWLGKPGECQRASSVVKCTLVQRTSTSILCCSLGVTLDCKLWWPGEAKAGRDAAGARRNLHLQVPQIHVKSFFLLCPPPAPRWSRWPSPVWWTLLTEGGPRFNLLNRYYAPWSPREAQHTINKTKANIFLC